MQAYRVGEEQLDIVAKSGVFSGEGFAEFYITNPDSVVSKIICNNCNLEFNHRTVTREDMIANISYLLNLMDGLVIRMISTIWVTVVFVV